MAKEEDGHWWFVARRRFIEVFWGGRSRKNLRIADIGAGTGGTTAWLGKYGHVVGVEPSELGRSLAKKRGIKLQKGTATRTGLPTNSVDAVTILDVLYHRAVPDDLKALQEAYRILRPGGTLLVTDCAFAWLAGRHHAAVHGARRYTLPQIVKKIQQAGFTVERKSYTFFLTLPFVFFKRLIPHGGDASAVGRVPIILSAVFRALCWIEIQTLKYFSLPLGSSVMVRARKPEEALLPHPEQ